MGLLFVTATAFEARAALPLLKPGKVEEADDPLPEQCLCPFDDKTGQRHHLLITGVGPINAAMALAANLDAARRAKAVVNLGVAGSFDLAAAPLGSIWRVQKEIWPEYGLAQDLGVDAKGLGFAQWRDGQGEDIWDRLNLSDPKESSTLPQLNLPVADALSVAGVTHSQKRAARLLHTYGGHAPLLENMEGFALALVCARHNIPMLEVRTVSNRVGSRAPQDRAFTLALTALQQSLHDLLAGTVTRAM